MQRGPWEEGAGAVGVDVHLDPRPDEMGAHRTGGDLQFERAVGHAIVVHDLAFLLHAQDLAELDPGIGVKAEPGSAAATAKRWLWAGR